MKENLSFKDRLSIVLYRNGSPVYMYQTEDLVTNLGKSRVAGLINGVFTTSFTYVAIGTGTVAPSESDTSLGNEVARVAATCSTVTTTNSGDTARLVGTFSFDATLAITESGVFNASSGGDMLCRQTFPVINVLPGDGLQITWDIQVQ